MGSHNGCMDIDPQMDAALTYMRERASLREGEVPAGMDEVRRNTYTDFAYWNEDPPKLHSVNDIQLNGAFGPRTVRHYQTEEHKIPAPALVHFHGGGWIVGDLDLEDRFLRELALESKLDIFSVDYVLAPEFPYPKPLEDCISVCESIAGHATSLGLDTKQLSISGSSAGANLALATALSLRDRHKQLFSQMLLFYGVFRASTDSDSHREFSDDRCSPGGPGLELFLQRYLSDQKQRTDPLVSPLDAVLTGLPPCYLCIAELDALRDDSLHLEQKLLAANVPTTSNFYKGVIHGFTLMSRTVDIAGTAINDAADYLKGQHPPGVTELE